MESDNVDEVIQSADGQELNGRNLRVDRAQERDRGPRRDG
jgi:RNA recognition motif-containing protein